MLCDAQYIHMYPCLGCSAYELGASGTSSPLKGWEDRDRGHPGDQLDPSAGDRQTPI